MAVAEVAGDNRCFGWPGFAIVGALGEVAVGAVFGGVVVGEEGEIFAFIAVGKLDEAAVATAVDEILREGEGGPGFTAIGAACDRAGIFTARSGVHDDMAFVGFRDERFVAAAGFVGRDVFGEFPSAGVVIGVEDGIVDIALFGI